MASKSGELTLTGNCSFSYGKISCLYTGLLNKSDPYISRYAKYLRGVYSTSPISISALPSPSKVFIKLALVKKEKVSQAQADNFTRLTLRGDVDHILQVKLKEPIAMDDILKADDKVRLVVVEGAPGIGKSTLAWELCRQWPTLESLKRFSLVVLLRLREEGVQSATNISDLFYHRDKQLSRHVGEEVEKGEGDGVLFVFDGFDEFPSELREKSLVMDIISGSKYLPNATVLVTSRPSASAQLQALLQTGIGKHIEVVGFSEKEILEFAYSVFDDTNLFANFRQYLSTNPPVKGMMYNPLNCAIVVGVYQDTYEPGKPAPPTQTQLYAKLTQYLLRRYLKKKQDPLANKLPDNLEDLPHDSDLYKQLVKVGRLAFNGTLKKELIIKQLPEGCSDLGLLVKHTALYTGAGSTTYNFFHLTLQEYMSAFYISQLPADEQRTLFSEHSTLMNVVWRFVAGLTKMQNIKWEEFKRVELGYWRVQPVSDVVTVDPLLLQCLYEAQYVQSCESVFGGYKLNSDVGSPYDVFILGYFVSLCNNTWNVHIWTSKGLEMLGHGMKSVDYGGGSIEELDLVRSSPDEEHLLHLSHHILQHIKSLGWKMSLMNQTGFDKLAGCITYLHSLTSLDISGNPGGNGSLVKLLKALRKHGRLQTLYMQCISIGMDDVAALADLIQPSSSLRELSVDGSNCGGKLLGPDIEQQLMKTVLQSSLQTLILHVSKAALLHLDSIKVIGVTSLSLNIYPESYPPSTQTANIGIKGGTKLSHILRENTSLKELTLDIPLDKDEVHDIIDSLKDNHSLERLWLSKEYHSQYFSLKEQQQLDHRIRFK